MQRRAERSLSSQQGMLPDAGTAALLGCCKPGASQGVCKRGVKSPAGGEAKDQDEHLKV